MERDLRIVKKTSNSPTLRKTVKLFCTRFVIYVFKDSYIGPAFGCVF